jgi:hypothetical protein
MDYSMLLIFFKKKEEPLRRGITMIRSKHGKRLVEVESEEDGQ